MKFPPVKGKLTFEGLPSTKFWVRVFGLEPHIAFVQSKINEKPERKMASVPIVNEYEVDPERLNFYYVMHLKVDALGIQGGVGAVFFSDKDNAATVMADRNKLAEQMLGLINQRHGELLEGYVVETGKEV